ncbi:MAG: hypothetical protein Unbinned2514contig1000_2 [Prokaryotic dsDNA virus sp.]|nr:MAG: hypothetical protein Unbinned2514contig1000_2 [Prokaryotic dsDNA virus sp.]|tara:strand:+ start:1805 stop:2029 length:225 start_codon:yes stop_codon:yes gene_type:complete
MHKTNPPKIQHPWMAVSIVEGFQVASDDERKQAWQYLIDTGLAFNLQGGFGQMAYNLISVGICNPPPEKQHGEW